MLRSRIFDHQRQGEFQHALEVISRGIEILSQSQNSQVVVGFGLPFGIVCAPQHFALTQAASMKLDQRSRPLIDRRRRSVHVRFTNLTGDSHPIEPPIRIV